MKPPERFPPDDPREWINRARSDLTQAKNEVPGVYLENLCFNAQQAAEKSIKAVMIARNIEFSAATASPVVDGLLNSHSPQPTLPPAPPSP